MNETDQSIKKIQHARIQELERQERILAEALERIATVQVLTYMEAIEIAKAALVEAGS